MNYTYPQLFEKELNLITLERIKLLGKATDNSHKIPDAMANYMQQMANLIELCHIDENVVNNMVKDRSNFAYKYR